jgi:hypothetical protein
VSSNSFGLSVRTRNSEVRYNYLHDVALEPDSPDWAGALWMAAGYAEQNWQPVTGIEIHNNVVENVHRGFAGGDYSPNGPVPQTESGFDLHHNVFIDAHEQYMGRSNGKNTGSFHHNLVIDSGSRNLGGDWSEFEFYENYFLGVEGESDSGPRPELDSDYHVQTDTGGAGLQDGVQVGGGQAL